MMWCASKSTEQRAGKCLLLLLAAWLAALLGLGPGCTFEVGSVELQLVYTSEAGRMPLDPARVRYLRVTVSGPGLEPHSEQFSPAGAGGSLTVPAGPQRQVLVEAVGNVGEVVSWGLSEPFEAGSGSRKLFVFLGQAGQFSPPPAGLGLTDPEWSQRFRTGMTSRRLFHSATLLPDGQVLLAGGSPVAGSADFVAPLAGASLRSLDLFNPYTGAMVNDTPSADCNEGRWCLRAGRAWHQAVLEENGHFVLVVGGEPAQAQWPQEAFDVATGQLVATADMEHPRLRSAAALLPGVGVVVAAGVDSISGALSADLEVYDQGFFTLWADALGEPRAAPAAVVIDGSQPRLVLLGGWRAFGPGDGWQASDAVDVVTFNGSTPQVSSHRLLHPRADHSAVVLEQDGGPRVLVCGGRLDPDTIEPSCEMFDPAAGNSTAVSLTVARWQHRATLLADGRVLISGGFTGGGLPLQASSSALLVDFPQGRIELPMVAPRAGHSATLLPNDMVLVVGGASELSPDGTVRFAAPDYEIFVPRRNGGGDQ